MIKAFKKLLKIRQDIHLVIVGNGILEKSINDTLISEISRIDFQNQTKMPIIYRLGDIFVLPSKGPGETWGLSVNEAMASGKPVIVSDRCGCHKNLVDDGINGFSFQANDLNDLSNKMEMILSEDLKKMGEHSRIKISDFNYVSFAKALGKIKIINH